MADKADRQYVQQARIPLPKVDYEDLMRKDMIYMNDNKIVLTQTGKSILNQLNNDPDVEVSDDFVDRYRRMFSRASIGVPGKMGDRNAIEKKLEVFMSEHSYTEEQILQATQEYVDSQRKDNYQYLQQADYFIYKQDAMKINKSRLAEWCEQLGEDTRGWQEVTL